MTTAQKSYIKKLQKQALRTDDDHEEAFAVYAECAGMPDAGYLDDIPELTTAQGVRYIDHLKEMSRRRRCSHCGTWLRNSHVAAQHSLVTVGDWTGPNCGLS